MYLRPTFISTTGSSRPPGERGSLDAVDRNLDISRRQPGCDTPDQTEFVDQIDAIDRDQETTLPNLVAKVRHQPIDELV
jgi:hypothetical protein